MRATRTMSRRGGNRHWYVLVVLLGFGVLSALSVCCGKSAEPPESRTPREVELPAYLKDTICEVAETTGREEIPVQGLGFVTGLDGTGTKALPPGIRQQMLDIMRRNKIEHPEEILSSPDNAVVMVSGRLTAGIGQGELFDLNVRAIPSTETTSLEGGFLLECDLMRVVASRGVESKSEILAMGRGPVFVSPISTDEKAKTSGDPRVGRVLGGGKDVKPRHFRLVLLTPSVRTAEHLIHLVNTRFPESAQGSEDPSQITLAVPPEYLDDKAHFLDLVGAIFMRETGDARDMRLNLLIRSLESGKDLDAVALDHISLCLEAMGATAIPRLRQLDKHPDPAVRLYAGRTLANLQDATAVLFLEPLATDDQSPYQEQAVEALGRLRSGIGLGIMARALDAKSPRVRLAAWQSMARLSPRQFVTRSFSDKFRVSFIPTKADPFIYIAQTLKPEIAVFGNLQILPPVLVETRRATATVVESREKVKTEPETITVFTRVHDHDFRLDAPLDVRGFIEKVASPAGLDSGATPQGLDLDYSNVVGLLLQMSARKSLSGPIVLQPLKFAVPGGSTRPIGEPEGPDINVGEQLTPAAVTKPPEKGHE